MESSASDSSGGEAAPCPPPEVAAVMANKSEEFLRKLAGLYGNNEMSDVILSVGERDFPAHRLILCISSEVFQVMLLNKQWSEAQESRVILQENAQCAAVFDKFLQFFYTGRVCITQDSALPLLCLADKYNVKDLSELCLDYMINHIVFAAIHNLLVSWLQYTQMCGHTKAAQACQNFVKWNFKMVAETSDFGQFDSDVFISLLQQNDLVVHDEMQLFNYVVIWLETQQDRMLEEEGMEVAMTQLIEAVMSHIRFPMMSPRQLAELLLSPLTQHNKEFFVHRMAFGMAFHAGQQSSVREAMLEEGGDRLFTPRLYTADTWSAMLTVENYLHVQPYHVRTLVFSSLRSCAEFEGDRNCEWVVDLYPRGVWFRKCLLIVWQGTVEVPESVLRTVRLSVTCRDPDNELHVKVGVLVCGTSAGIEHIALVRETNHYFDADERALNFDNLLPFEESEKKKFLSGPNQDVLKMHIIIAPLSKLPSRYT